MWFLKQKQNKKNKEEKMNEQVRHKFHVICITNMVEETEDLPSWTTKKIKKLQCTLGL